MEASESVQTLSLIKVISESKRIIGSQPRLFLVLSSLFLLPLSVAAAIYPILTSLIPEAISKSFLNLIAFDPQQADFQAITFPIKTLLLVLAYSLFSLVFSSFAVISITYSVIHGFSGQPIKLKAAIKSIATSFFPLLGTALLTQTIIISIGILFGILFALLINGARLSGFQIEFSSPYFLLLWFVLLIPLFFIIIRLQVNWSLLNVVVVVESTWGLEAMKRSVSLIKGRRQLALSLFLLFGFSYGVSTWSMNCFLADPHWKRSVFRLALLVLANSAFQTLVLLYEMAANGVLYVYCKKATVDYQDKEFCGEYVSLPTNDDEKAPCVVSFASSKLECYEV